MRFRIASSGVFGSSLRFSNLSTHQRCYVFRTQHLRFLHNDGRTCISSFWVPTGGIAHSTTETEDSNAVLIRGGFIRQAHSGIFHFLPLGLRVQEKLERLLDKHMTRIGASKVSLSTFSSEELWGKSGRLSSSNSELFRLRDRKEAGYLLSPTHEEEITSLVGSIVKSYKDLPLRLYQITRKYRDEPRPRQGLFRTREFLMKDLYTFDATRKQALETYATAQNAYAAFFHEFGVPFYMTSASSGEMGGDLSHEVHIASEKGEDNIVLCDSCKYAANEEVAQRGLTMAQKSSMAPHEDDATTSSNEAVSIEPEAADEQSKTSYRVWTGLTSDRQIIVQAFYPPYVIRADPGGKGVSWEADAEPKVLRSLVEGLDLGIENPLQLWKQSVSKHDNDPLYQPRIIWIFDQRLPQALIDLLLTKHVLDPHSEDPTPFPAHAIFASITRHPRTYLPIDLIKLSIRTGDPCPRCPTGTLRVLKSVEVGHNFHLGTRYSKPLNATVASDSSMTTWDPKTLKSLLDDSGAEPVPGRTTLQMGCHGIGVSRLLAAIASALASPHGLNWPRCIAPFEAVVMASKVFKRDGELLYDALTQEFGGRDRVKPVDAIWDDRDKELPWKLKDADLIGYPVVVVLGRSWKVARKVEVQCRRLGVREDVEVGEVRRVVEGFLERVEKLGMVGIGGGEEGN